MLYRVGKLPGTAGVRIEDRLDGYRCGQRYRFRLHRIPVRGQYPDAEPGQGQRADDPGRYRPADQPGGGDQNRGDQSGRPRGPHVCQPT